MPDAAPAPAPPNATEIIALKGLPYLEEYNGRILVNTSIAMLVLSTVAVALRFLARHMSRGRWWWDDWLVIPGFLFIVALVAEAFILINVGADGFHVERVMISHPDGLILWIKFLVIGPFLYTFAVLFTKCTILCVYLRVFTERPYRIACYIVIVVHILQTIAVCAADVAQCQPLAFLWDKTIEGGKCPVNATELFRWASLPNIVTDIVMLLLPLPYIWKLHASIQIKAALALTLATGSVGLITSIVRFAIFFDNQVVDDGTWTSVSLISLTIVECSMYLISGCLPIYRPLYVWCRRSLGLSTGETAYNSTGVRSGVSTGGGGGGSSSKATHFSRMHSYHSQRSLENAFEKGDDKYATEFSILEARSDHRPHSSHVGGYSRGEMA